MFQSRQRLMGSSNFSSKESLLNMRYLSCIVAVAFSSQTSKQAFATVGTSTNPNTLKLMNPETFTTRENLL